MGECLGLTTLIDTGALERSMRLATSTAGVPEFIGIVAVRIPRRKRGAPTVDKASDISGKLFMFNFCPCCGKPTADGVPACDGKASPQ